MADALIAVVVVEDARAVDELPVCKTEVGVVVSESIDDAIDPVTKLKVPLTCGPELSVVRAAEFGKLDSCEPGDELGDTVDTLDSGLEINDELDTTSIPLLGIGKLEKEIAVEAAPLEDRGKAAGNTVVTSVVLLDCSIPEDRLVIKFNTLDGFEEANRVVKGAAAVSVELKGPRSLMESLESVINDDASEVLGNEVDGRTVVILGVWELSSSGTVFGKTVDKAGVTACNTD